MHTIHTFVLKVVRDQNSPDVLRGMLTTIATGDEYDFVGEGALIELLRGITAFANADAARSDVSPMETSAR